MSETDKPNDLSKKRWLTDIEEPENLIESKKIKLDDRDREADEVRLEDYNNSNTFRVFATNYKILRIMSGMAGLCYEN